MRSILFAVGFVVCGQLAAAEPAVPTIKPDRVIGDPRLRVGDDIPRIRMSPDGKHLVSCCNDGTIRWWDVKTYKEVKRWAPEKSTDLWDVLFLPNDRMLVASAANKVSLIDLKTGKELKSYPHEDSVYRICLSKDKKRFLACGSFKVAILWDIETGKKKQTFKGHKEDIYAVSFSHDESLVYTCGDDKTWRVWSVETGKEEWQKDPGGDDLYVLERHPTKDLMAICSSKRGMWVADLDTKESKWNSSLHQQV